MYIFGDLTINADLIAGRFFQMDPTNGALAEIIPTNNEGNRLAITGFGRDTQGELYVMGNTANDSVVYRLVAAG